MKQYRQGDVYLFPVEHVELEDAKVVPLDRGKVILAYGEVTGHAHCIDVDEQSAVQLFELATGQRVLVVEQDSVPLRHGTIPGGPGDHETLTVARGQYDVRIASEYSPQEVRRVYD